MEDEFYTVEEVAARFKVTRQAVYNWIADGRLEAIRLGKARRIPRQALEKFLAREQEQDQKNAAA